MKMRCAIGGSFAGLIMTASMMTASAGAAPLPGTVSVPKWSTHEITLTATNRYASPYVSVDLLGVFSGPNGASAVVNGFWDGGQTFRIRFTPTVEGTWSYATVSDDPGLDAQSGFINCVKADAAEHGFVRYAPGAAEKWTYDDGTAVASEAATATVGVRARVARCGGDGDPCEASIGPGRDFVDIATLQAADARVKEALGGGRLVEICLFDAGDAATTGEARTYRYVEYMTAPTARSRASCGGSVQRAPPRMTRHIGGRRAAC